TVAFVVLLVALPVMLIVAMSVWIGLGRPILFVQERPGLHGKVFRLYKFRSMRDLVDSSGRVLSDDQRLTSLGRFLRRSSLDELPQLFNVLRGTMSLVGPRPLLTQYLPLYSAAQYRRHEMKPGITGWAQVSGRNALTWEEKFRLDVLYVDRWNLLIDIRILLVTALRVVRASGISQYGHATVEYFRGNDPEPSPLTSLSGS
ncbi:MAG TPA: sugar transferase, partial [Acidimicrobiales bacterium]|nr:sugar transferase [Acidimicrobiales bacterium]